jgi:aryl-alcohol dehydrogenase-like predicted oxidoreductase
LIVPRARPREWDDDGFIVPGDRERRWDFSAAGVERSLRESLDRLATARPAPGATYGYGPPDASVLERVGASRRSARTTASKLPAAALAFPLMHPAVAAVAVGMRSPREVDEDVRHFTTDVPAGLWRDLVAAGLIPAGAVAPGITSTHVT